MRTTLTVDDDGILTFPDELIEKLGWKEGDVLQWIDNKDGSFTLKKDET
jgi:bifunctional DNA-binding transcriptional regulator/antitoxin component of YhaV-PrlF toxin-antitoxin module